MKRVPITSNHSVVGERRVNKEVNPVHVSIDALDLKLRNLITNVTNGDHLSTIRLEAIRKLLDPTLVFHETDLERILYKDYPLPVKRGLMLYRTMQRLTFLCEPIGGRIGPAQRIRLINFEKLSWDNFLRLKGGVFMLFGGGEESAKAGREFNGIQLLSPEDKELYKK